MNTDSYFTPIDEHRYKPTLHASGAWDANEQHFSPLAGLIVHAIDRYQAAKPDRGLVLARVGFDILGRLVLDECEIQVETRRPGRTIELIEAVALIAGRPAVRANAWFLAAIDTSSIAGGADERLAPPKTLTRWPLSILWQGGFVASLDVRPLAPPLPGRTTAWVSTCHDLVAGQPVSRLASYIALVDTANGIAVRQPPTTWRYPNVDLTIHLHRQPEGPWTGLDTTVTFGPTGHGVTTTVLHDITGPVGHAQQILTLRPQPSHRP